MTMPATGFNVPRGSFPTPQQPPGVGPLVGPLVSVSFNFEWCKFIVGSLSQLLLNTTWDVATQAELTAIQEQVFDLMAAFCVDPKPNLPALQAGAGGGDEFMLRQNPDNPCELQTSVDGVTWCTWADLSKCQPAPAQPGTDSPQPQPGGGCVTYHAVLPANGKWLAPTFVNSGDVVSVSNVKGVWNGGTINWFCADGTPFVGFVCIGLGGPQSGDPDPTVNHMALIFHLSGGLYSPILAGPVTIPGGVVANTLEFQANDSILSDNAGQLEFDVTICNNETATWESRLDFRTSPYGFADHNTDGAAVWTPGSGFVVTPDATGGIYNSDVFRTLDTCQITHWEVNWTASGYTAPAGNVGRLGAGGTIVINPLIGSGSSGTSTYDGAAVSTTEMNMANGGGGGAGSYTLVSMVVRGTGTKPSQLP